MIHDNIICVILSYSVLFPKRIIHAHVQRELKLSISRLVIHDGGNIRIELRRYGTPISHVARYMDFYVMLPGDETAIEVGLRWNVDDVLIVVHALTFGVGCFLCLAGR